MVSHGPHAPVAPVMLVGETSSSSWECLLHLLPLFSADLGQPTLQCAHGQGFPALLLGRRVLLSPCDTLNLHTDPRRWLAPAPARLSLSGTPLLLQRLPSLPGHCGVHRPQAGRGRVCGDRRLWAHSPSRLGVVPAPPREDGSIGMLGPQRMTNSQGQRAGGGGKLRSDTCRSLTSINASTESRCGFPWPHTPPWLPGPGQELYGGGKLRPDICGSLTLISTSMESRWGLLWPARPSPHGSQGQARRQCPG